MERFANKVVIVTGAGSGIGAAAARRFSDEGARVVLAGRHEQSLREQAKALAPDRTLCVVTDVRDYESCVNLVAVTLKEFSRIDVLVNNAGVAPEGRIDEASLEDWNNVMATNIGGVFHCSRAALEALRASRGCIVNTASVSGLGGDWKLSFYNASKGAIVNFTRAMALDHASEGIRVNAVCPSLTFTPMTEDMAHNAKLMKRFEERIPMGRGARPEEVAAVMAFLASDDAGFVTGVNLPVDGGLTASNGQPRMG